MSVRRRFAGDMASHLSEDSFMLSHASRLTYVFKVSLCSLQQVSRWQDEKTRAVDTPRGESRDE